MTLPVRFDDVTQADLEAVLGGLVEPSFSYNSLFPYEFTSNLSWEVLEHSGNMTVAADVVSHDASVKLKARPDAAIQTGEIPKLGLLTKVGEKQLHNLYALQNNPRGTEQQIFNIIFGDIERVYRGVHARMEIMAMQALSSGVVSTAANNEGLSVTATYNIPAGNRFGAGTAIWSTPATATPIADLKNVTRTARANGHLVQRIVMNQATMDNMLATDEVKAMYSGLIGLSNALLNPTAEQVNVILNAQGIAPITVVDPAVPVEAADGTTSIIDPWSAGKVTFLTSQTAGRSQWTFTAEEKMAGYTAPDALASNRDIVRVTRYSEVNPFSVYTKGESVAFPVLANTSQIYQLNTLNLTTWS